jgi:anthranilate/para-aminobenzoate synthase component I
MSIQDINDQLKLKHVEFQITQEDKKRMRIQNKIKELEYKKEIEQIKDKIRKLSNI